MHLDPRVCDHARLSRDARFDGRFFIGVTTTKVYCRPVCPVPAPRPENVRYFPSAAAAAAEGFRPCLRCRPESSPGTPAWFGTSAVVSRGLRLINDGVLDREGVEQLADRLGVTARHVRRLFLRHLGATPHDVALTRRVHFAKKLIDETTLGFAAVAAAAGFGSLRRFNGQIRGIYSRTPTELRRLARRKAEDEPGCYRFRLAYRPPYDWDEMLRFLASRAIPGVEAVENGHYRRTIAVGDAAGSIDVCRAAAGDALAVEVRSPDSTTLLATVERIRRLFDLAADPTVIAAHLGGDPLLRVALARHPGVRTPGAWDGFELAIRAVLGQQVTVRAASTLAGRLAAAHGTPVAAPAGLTHLFPSPAQLIRADIERVGVIGTRAQAIRRLASEVTRGAISFSAHVDTEETVSKLEAIPGIGPWTAQYIAMRGLSEPDAFPSGDLVLRRVAGVASARQLERRAEAWRPWRAYAVILLWQAASETPTEPPAAGRGADRAIAIPCAAAAPGP